MSEQAVYDSYIAQGHTYKANQYLRENGPIKTADSAPQFQASASPIDQQMKSSLEQSIADATGTVSQSFADYVSGDPILSQLRADADGFVGDTKDTIQLLTAEMENPAVDVDALVGRLDQSFTLTSNKIMDATMASAQKSSMDMDAYLGSSRSDARSAVRSQMAGSIAAGMVANASQAIAQIYSGHTASVVDTILKGAKINADNRGVLAGAIAGLTDSAGKVLFGTTQTLVGAYTSTIDTAAEMIRAKASVLGMMYQAETARYQADTQRYGIESQAYTAAQSLNEKIRVSKYAQWNVEENKRYNKWAKSMRSVGSTFQRSENPYA